MRERKEEYAKISTEINQEVQVGARGGRGGIDNKRRAASTCGREISRRNTKKRGE